MSETLPKMSKPVVSIKRKLESIDEIKEAVVAACKVMEAFGLVQGHGHVSSRLPDGENLLVTPKKSPYLITKEELLVVDSNGKLVEGAGTPLGEMCLHTAIYRNRPDVGAICRFHSEMTSVFGVLKRPVRVVHALGYLVGPEVRVFDSPDLQVDPELADRMVETLGGDCGIILRGNGAATVGSNVIEACVRALFLDESAKLQYKASLVGAPEYLSMAEIDRRNEFYWRKIDSDPYWRAWEYFVSKVT